VSGRVLIIAGSDSGGGAGIQADIKTVTALGGYAATAVTALTVQNTEGVAGILDVPADFVAQQIAAVLRDIGADCIKIGMLHRADIIDSVAQALAQEAPGIPVVLDPVMVAKGGHRLLTPDAVEVLRARLVPGAFLVTPNLPEAQALAGGAIGDAGELARRLVAIGPAAALVKGGHASGPIVTDVLLTAGGVAESFGSERIESRNTHGTGCTLASAIATGIAQGRPLRDAVIRARSYVRDAILTAPGLGRGHGPLNHGHTVRPYHT
jgi:hydroxymethylpyrimidine/phosphomethylpyrimidine kinase